MLRIIEAVGIVVASDRCAISFEVGLGDANPISNRETQRLGHYRGRVNHGSGRARKWKPIRDEGEECDETRLHGRRYVNELKAKL